LSELLQAQSNHGLIFLVMVVFTEKKWYYNGKQKVEVTMADIYDSVFRTILNDCRKLIIPVINEIFGENYTGNEEIEFFPNEHFLSQQDKANQKRITDTNFIIYGTAKKKYHWECQSTPDSKMLIRMFEYDAQIALDQGEVLGETLTVAFPHSAVLYLRCHKNTPGKMRYIIHTPGGTVGYDVPIMKIISYTFDEIFDKRLLLVLPFYIFSFEDDFPEYNEDSEKLSLLKVEYKKIVERLEFMERDGKIGAFDKRTIIELSEDVLKEIAKKYENIRKGIGDIMGGALLKTDARSIKDEGRKEGRKEGKKEGRREGKIEAYIEIIQDGLISIKEAAVRLHVTEDVIRSRMEDN